MNKETAKCVDCGNVNEVKVATGHNNPENKGKKYFTCAGCGKFQWVKSTNSPSAESFDASLKEPIDSYKDRSNRIERQHSQDMAISFLDLAFRIHPENFLEIEKPLKDLVKEYTDWFQNDLDSSSEQKEN